MKALLKGQKLSIEKEILSKYFYVGLDWDKTSCPNYEIDVTIMLLSDRGKLEEEEDFIFYNNPNSKCGSVKIHSRPLVDNYKKTIEVNLNKIPSNISRIKFILTIDNGDKLNHRFGNVKNISAKILDESTRNGVLEYNVEGMTKETALMVLDIYKHNNEWKLQAVGSGFNSGLDAILKEFGSEKVQVLGESPTPTPPPKNIEPPKPKIDPTPPPKNIEPPKSSSISLSKITLEKKGDSTKIDLSKHSTDKSEIHVNLNWNQKIQKGGFFRKTESIDLDLGCMYELASGEKGVIQALGGNFGSKFMTPYIALDKDDRTGTSTDGENIFITRPDLIKKLVIFSFIYEGHSDFLEAGAVLRIKGMNNDITINLDSPRPYLTFCIGASIENNNGIIKIQKVDEYVKDHIDCDKMFGFNFKWRTGSK